MGHIIDNYIMGAIPNENSSGYTLEAINFKTEDGEAISVDYVYIEEKLKPEIKKWISSPVQYGSFIIKSDYAVYIIYNKARKSLTYCKFKDVIDFLKTNRKPALV